MMKNKESTPRRTARRGVDFLSTCDNISSSLCALFFYRTVGAVGKQKFIINSTLARLSLAPLKNAGLSIAKAMKTILWQQNLIVQNHT